MSMEIVIFSTFVNIGTLQSVVTSYFSDLLHKMKPSPSIDDALSSELVGGHEVQ